MLSLLVHADLTKLHYTDLITIHLLWELWRLLALRNVQLNSVKQWTPTLNQCTWFSKTINHLSREWDNWERILGLTLFLEITSFWHWIRELKVLIQLSSCCFWSSIFPYYSLFSFFLFSLSLSFAYLALNSSVSNG